AFSGSFMLDAPDAMPLSLFQTIYSAAAKEGFTGLLFATPGHDNPRANTLTPVILSRHECNYTLPGGAKWHERRGVHKEGFIEVDDHRPRVNIFRNAALVRKEKETKTPQSQLFPQLFWALFRHVQGSDAHQNPMRQIVLELTQRALTVRIMVLQHHNYKRELKMERIPLAQGWRRVQKRLHDAWFVPNFPAGLVAPGDGMPLYSSEVQVVFHKGLSFGTLKKAILALRSRPKKECSMKVSHGKIPFDPGSCMFPVVALEPFPKTPRRPMGGAMDYVNLADYLWNGWPDDARPPFFHFESRRDFFDYAVLLRGSRNNPWVKQVVPTVKERSTKSKGPVDVNEIRAVLRAHRRNVLACYGRELMKQNSLGGEVTVSATIMQNGHVGVCTVKKHLAAGKQVGRCLCERMKILRFPTPTKGTASFVHTWTFAPGEGTK
ncbi:AgmX/PglI C-terminal domain-containing protein, partial [Myxococcota bacterium]|nr:AgmX/PglI C-terminal domain-containing protein [Myxococcota bacterium]